MGLFNDSTGPVGLLRYTTADSADRHSLHRLRYSLHIGCRVLSGVKWVSNAWMVSILVAPPRPAHVC